MAIDTTGLDALVTDPDFRRSLGDLAPVAHSPVFEILRSRRLPEARYFDLLVAEGPDETWFVSSERSPWRAAYVFFLECCKVQGDLVFVRHPPTNKSWTFRVVLASDGLTVEEA